MKLVRFTVTDETPRIGMLEGDRVYDLSATYQRLVRNRAARRSSELASALAAASMRRIIHDWEEAAYALSRMREEGDKGRLKWVGHPRSSVRLLAPIHDPGKFIGVGLNYKDHAEEIKQPVPTQPPLFAKWANAILDPGHPIVRPHNCRQLDYEVELGVIIGRTCRDAEPEHALDHVFGYTIVHDVSARDLQFATSQWMAGKIQDGFAPMGPWIADRHEIPDPHVLELRTWVNGVLYQNGNTRNMIFDVAALISYISRLITLNPGDVIATGTPAGVGFTRKPPVFLQPGDAVTLEITGLGTLQNPVQDP
ncbi:MAG: fumarylacetoacetate hydrolase family protein [Gammaproteobacteria bacterium]|nr:fumarylacetoacetate hydrolase family protein [Gammaproteobacteria bacterium]